MEKAASVESLPPKWMKYIDKIDELTREILQENFKNVEDGVYDYFCEMSRKPKIVVVTGGKVYTISDLEILNRLRGMIRLC
ncbi:MAG: hypothetical protein WC514_00185 [Candidatus Paceibacterota bacterium]